MRNAPSSVLERDDGDHEVLPDDAEPSSDSDRLRTGRMICLRASRTGHDRSDDNSLRISEQIMTGRMACLCAHPNRSRQVPRHVPAHIRQVYKPSFSNPPGKSTRLLAIAGLILDWAGHSPMSVPELYPYRQCLCSIHIRTGRRHPYTHLTPYIPYTHIVGDVNLFRGIEQCTSKQSITLYLFWREPPWGMKAEPGGTIDRLILKTG